MPSYEPVKQKTEEESESDEALPSQNVAGDGESEGNESNSLWNRKRRRVRSLRFTEISLVLLLLVSNISWFLSLQKWAQPKLKDPDYCEFPVVRLALTMLTIIFDQSAGLIKSWFHLIMTGLI